MSNGLGELLKELRGRQSLRMISAKTGDKVSFSYLGIIEKGIHPNTGQPVKPTPDVLKTLSDVYNYPYEELLKVAGYLEESSIDKVKKLYEEFEELLSVEQKQLIGLLKAKYDWI